MNVPWQAEIWALMKANKIGRSDLAEAAEAASRLYLRGRLHRQER